MSFESLDLYLIINQIVIWIMFKYLPGRKKQQKYILAVFIVKKVQNCNRYFTKPRIPAVD
jgi:hypothetical protein